MQSLIHTDFHTNLPLYSALFLQSIFKHVFLSSLCDVFHVDVNKQLLSVIGSQCFFKSVYISMFVFPLIN